MHAIENYLNAKTEVLAVNYFAKLDNSDIPLTLCRFGQLLSQSIQAIPSTFYSVVFIKLSKNSYPIDKNKCYCTLGETDNEALVDIAYASTLPNGYIISPQDLSIIFTKLKLAVQKIDLPNCDDFVWVKSKNKPKEIIIPRCPADASREFIPTGLSTIDNTPAIVGLDEIRYAKGQIKPVFKSKSSCLDFHHRFRAKERRISNPLLIWKEFVNQDQELFGLPLSEEYQQIKASKQKDSERFKLAYPTRLQDKNLFWVLREGKQVIRKSDGQPCLVKRVTYKSDSDPPIVELEVPDEPAET